MFATYATGTIIALANRAIATLCNGDAMQNAENLGHVDCKMHDERAWAD